MNLLYITHHRRVKTIARSEAWAREMVRRGHAVTLLCLGDRERWHTREYDRDGIHWVETPDLLWGRLRSGWDPVSAVRRMRWLQGRRFDLIHCFETRPATIFPVLWHLRKNPTPLAMDWNDWWGRGGLITVNRPRWYRFAFGGMETFFEEHYRVRADLTTVISNALAERAVGLGVRRETIRIIRGGVDVSLFMRKDSAAARVELGLPLNHTLLAYIGRDVNYDMPLILQALRRVRAGNTNVSLVLVGNRPPNWSQILRDYGSSEGIYHLGLVPFVRIPDVLAAADICLLPLSDVPANRGGWPHKLGDYLAAGRPFIANPVGDVGQFMRQENVGLAAEDQPVSFAQAILDLASDRERRERMGRDCRAVAERLMTWNVVADAVEGSYRTFLPSATG